MITNLAPAWEKDIVMPSLEMGAFEALWANGVSSFKQLRDKLAHSASGLLSQLVSEKEAQKYFEMVTGLLHSAKINDFGLRIDGTLDYPDRLHDADYPVTLLYYRGNWDLVFTRGISIVGTRKPSLKGLKRAEQLTRDLVKENFTIYSGLADGIDTIAHKTAIALGGNTVAVIGTPLSVCYPQQNKNLQEEIAKHHLLISQVPVVSYLNKNISFTRLFFPERNKTMAALTEATIIVEAGNTSGTLVQAKAALKQGRKVFILENNFENLQLTWPSQLMQKGAVRAKSIDDILQGLSIA